MRKNLKIILTVSILLNVFLVGLSGGMIYKRMRHSPWHEMKSQLSPEAKNIVARSFQQGRREAGPAIRQTMAARRDLIKVLEADEFDVDAYDAAVKKLQNLQNKLTDVKINATRNLAEALPADERKKMARNLATSFSGHKNRFHEKFDHPKREKNEE